MRKAFSDALVEAARNDPRVLLLTGDHGYALFDAFRRHFPERFLNAGVAEQNMVGVAAGLAKSGLRPVVYGLSAFVPVRVLEQIKIDVCYENLPVIFIGDGAGVVYSTLGTSHQSTEDVAVLRGVPGIHILSPADAHEMTACMTLAFATDRPVYLRMGKADLGEVHSARPALAWGRLLTVRQGTGPLAWIATGSMVQTALAAAQRWPGSSVFSCPSLKPLSQEDVAAVCRSHRVVVTVEEHSVMGGLGGAVAEIATSAAPVWVCRVGISDRFSRYCGSYQYLMKEHRLDLEAVVAKVELFLEHVPGELTVRRAA
jgi:transketolase